MLAALHVGMSFALGQWAAPMLPVGEDADGKVVWENWRVYHCDPARSINSGWWYNQDYESLGCLLGPVIKAFCDRDRLAPLRLQMMLAIAASSDQGFVEQRIMAGAAGLEHFMWQTLVLEGGMNKRDYKSTATHIKLRGALEAANIPIDIDPNFLPTTTRFTADEKARQGRELDGADVVTQVRNRLVHPEGAQEHVYRLDGLVAEVLRLVRHYLVLLILHSLDYRGSYRDLRKIQGWVGDVVNVPWG